MMCEALNQDPRDLRERGPRLRSGNRHLDVDHQGLVVENSLGEHLAQEEDRASAMPRRAWLGTGAPPCIEVIRGFMPCCVRRSHARHDDSAYDARPLGRLPRAVERLGLAADSAFSGHEGSTHTFHGPRFVCATTTGAPHVQVSPVASSSPRCGSG